MPLIIPSPDTVDPKMAVNLIQALTEAVQTLAEFKNPVYGRMVNDLANATLERIAELIG